MKLTLRRLNGACVCVCQVYESRSIPPAAAANDNRLYAQLRHTNDVNNTTAAAAAATADDGYEIPVNHPYSN
jgi:hypothetical protein